MDECLHKDEFLKNLEDSTFYWCTLCGCVLHFIKTGGVFIQGKDGILCDFSNQGDAVCYFDSHNPRAQRHEHDWFKLTQDYRWCTICGVLEIKRFLSSSKTQLPEIRTGLLFPKKRQARLEILREANLIKVLHDPQEQYKEAKIALVSLLKD